MTTIPKIILTFLAAFLFLSSYAFVMEFQSIPKQIDPVHAPFPMPELSRPAFPDQTFNIQNYGAVGDGKVKNTTAIAAAIKACAKAGGGTVLIPKGEWLTGKIHLKSNINLHLSESAVLKFSDDPQDYLPVVFTRWAGFECYNYSPLIYANNCTNIAITGRGSIDGNGTSWWSWAEIQQDTAYDMYENQILKNVSVEKRIYGTPEAGLRPQLIAPINCKNVLLEDFSIVKPGPFWTIHLTYCDHVIVRNLKVLTTGGPNTDGLNIDSSKNVLIEHCFFNTGDDCICMKSGINEDGWRVGKPTENVVIRHNRTNQGHGGIVFGSDTSGGIRNIFGHDNVFQHTLIGIRFKSTRGRGGIVENLWFKNIDMADIKTQAIRIETNYKAWFASNGGKPPVFRNIHFNSIQCEGTGQEAIKIQGLPDKPIENITFEEIKIKSQKGLTATHVKNIRLKNTAIIPEHGPKMRWGECDSVVKD